ncbi:HSF-type DNA-binding-domain-containing protein [Halteromyces radiatus]|uniref:HSF-type DNA-binding-domain-containing protein n=1 Tax=Halteromyces radiatus TaxID=101107 RepID=UPI002220E45F|nr:HSF-type DNA-binding-domain-containing protein [Halteromyces radiatus]KAI8098986.1 HSF-type DNA-binding-domain-containing protein [Halteromyces radiatus]
MSFNHVSNNNDDTVDNVNEQFIYESPSSFSILRTQPAFIGKLYKMLEDDTQDLICWSTDGDYFSVYNSALFAKQVLPQYFKHNNWQSFVRQLNMYGFSKINEMIHSNISFDNQTWDFKHPHFKRGDFQSLSLVKRKSVKSSSTTISSPSSSSSSYNTSQNDIINTKSQQQPSQQCDSFDENDIVHNRVGLLDEQVHQVSNNVNQLTNDVQDIKSIIYQQQNIIHDLANMVRSYQGK